MLRHFYQVSVKAEDKKLKLALLGQDEVLLYRPSAIITKFSDEEFRHVHYDFITKTFILRKSKEKDKFSHYLIFYREKPMKPLFYIPVNKSDWITSTDDFEEVFDFVNWSDFEIGSDYAFLDILSDLHFFAKKPIEGAIKLGTVYYEPKVEVVVSYDVVSRVRVSYEPTIEGAEFDKELLVEVFKCILGK